MENRKFARYFFTLVAEPVEARSLSLWSDRLTNRAVAVAEPVEATTVPTSYPS